MDQCPWRSKRFDERKSSKIEVQLTKEAYLNDMVSSTFMIYDNSPHFLMELSKHEYSMIQKYCIHVGGINFVQSKQGSNKKTHTTFESVKYGAYVSRHTHEGKEMLNLNRTKRKMNLITMNKSECEKSPSNVHIINTCLQGNPNYS